MLRHYRRYGSSERYRRRSHCYLWWLLLVLLAPSLALSATMTVTMAVTVIITTTPVYAQSSDLDRQAREIGADLRCPVCQNLSVADSPSPLAGEMRAIILQKLQAGESHQAIMQYFVDRYGQSILLNPPQQGFTLLVWLGAAAAVMGGAALLALRLRLALAHGDLGGSPQAYSMGAYANATGSDESELGQSDPYEAALDSELDQYKQGAGM